MVDDFMVKVNPVYLATKNLPRQLKTVESRVPTQSNGISQKDETASHSLTWVLAIGSNSDYYILARPNLGETSKNRDNNK